MSVSVEQQEQVDDQFREPLTAARDVPAASDEAKQQRDAFAAAAEALNFTGEHKPIRVEDDAEPVSRQELRRRAASHRTINTPFRKFAAATASAAAVGAVALIGLGVALPLANTSASTQAAADVATTTEAGAAETEGSDEVSSQLQGYVAGENVESQPLERVEGYEASTRVTVGSAEGISTAGAFFENDASADIQYPFAVGTSMSSPFGFRWGRMHEGVDFTPGDGAPIQAVADGVVRTATEAGGAYGVNVYIDHVVDGELVTSHYAHMQYGSLRVVEGQRVEVGDIIGLTGNTGRSYGAHMHFEIRYNGTAIDPLPWLEEHAGTRYSKEEKAQVEQQESQLLGVDFTEEPED